MATTLYSNQYIKTMQARTEKAQAERFARDQYRKQENELKQYQIRAEAEYKKQEAEAQALAIKEAEEERKNTNFFERVGSTLWDIGGNILGGIGKGIEGIIDFGAGVVGGVGGLFGADGFQDDVKDFIAKDHVDDTWGQMLTDTTKASYLHDWGAVGETIRGVSQGVGQMLPSIALSALAPPLGTAAFMTSAAGSGTEEAYQSGAGYGQGLAYGTASGIIEGGIEKLSGGIGGSKAGKVLGKQLGKSTLGKLGITMVGEGLEEVASDIINPGLKRLTGVDKEAKIDWEQLPKTFAIGGLTGVVIGGGNVALQGVKNRNIGGIKAVNAMDNLQNYNKIGNETNLQQTEGELTEKAELSANKDRADYLSIASKQIQKIASKKRAAFIEQNKLANTFNEDGTIKISNEKLAVGYNKNAYSYSLQGKEDSLEYKPTAHELTTDQQEAISNATKLKQGNINIVITDEITLTADDGTITKGNGSYREGTLYISREADIPQTIAAHELTHTLEGTKEYNSLANFVLKGIPDLDIKIQEKLKQYKNVNTEYSQEAKRYEAQTELVADFMGEALTSSEAVESVTRSNRNLAVRIYNWVKEKLSSLKKDSYEKSEAYKFYSAAEKLYSKALKTGFGGISLNDIDEDLQEEEKSEENNQKDSQIKKTSDHVAPPEKTTAVEMKSLVSSRINISSEPANKGLGIGDSKVIRNTSDNSIRDNSEKVNSANENKRYAIDSTQDKNPIRYSLVKDNNDLVAIHNLTEEKLLGILELGGFPMPSIAVTKPTILHDNFGEISVIFDKSAVDPKQAGNATFPGDAYSPRFPSVAYKINNKARTKARDRVVALLDGLQLPERMTGAYTIFHEDNVGSDIERRGGFAEANISDKTLQMAFLKDKKIDYEMPMKEEALDGFPVNFWEELSAKIPTDFQDNSPDGQMQYEPVIRELYKKYYAKMQNADAPKALFDKPLKWSSFGFDVHGAFDNLTKFRSVGKRNIIDAKALYEILDSKVDEQEFREWLTELSADFIEKKGLRNNVDPYTSSGNSRSFEALHYEYTLQNIIKAMKAEGLNGAEGGFFGGSPSLLAARLMDRFSSIEEMKSRAEVLQILKEEDKTQIKDMESSMLSEISAEMAGEDVSFEKQQGAIEKIGEIAERKLFTPAKILSYLTREYKGVYNFNTEIANKIIDLFAVLRKHPTTYFEAKPLRTVGFDEVKAVIVPNDISSELKSALTENNLPVYEYSKGESRKEIISKLDNVRFSLKTFSEQVDETIAGTLPKGDAVLVSKDTPQILQKIGLNNLPMLVTQKHLKDINTQEDGIHNYHGLDIKTIKELPKFIENPAMLLDSLTDTQSIVVVTDKLDSKNRPVIVAVNVDGNGMYLKVDVQSNFITSFYGRNEFDSFIRNCLAQNKLLYFDKEKSRKLYDTMRVQFPQALTTFDSNTIIRKTNANVNSKNKNNERFSLKETTKTKKVANERNEKVYSKKNTKAIINEILASGYNLSNEAKINLSDYLFNKMNTSAEGLRAKHAFVIADYILQNAALEDIYKDNSINNEAKRQVEVIREYVGKLDLKSIYGEMEHRFDKNGAKGIQLAWGQKEGGIALDELALELSERGIKIEAINEADIFFEIKNIYDTAKQSLRKEALNLIKDSYSASELKNTRQNIVKQILKSYDAYGKDSWRVNFENTYKEKFIKLKDKLKVAEKGNKVKNAILDAARTAKDIAAKEYPSSAGVLRDKDMKQFLDFVKSLKSGADINKDARKKVAELAKVYHAKNFLINSEFISDLFESDFDQNIADNISLILENIDSKEALSYDELVALKIISKGILHLYNNYDKVFRNGKLESLTDIATKGIDVSLKTAKYKKKSGFFQGLFGKLGDYIKSILDPKSIFKSLDYYDSNGIMTEMFNDLVDGENKKNISLVELLEPLEKFYIENKLFKKHLTNDIVKLPGTELNLTVNEAMALYLTAMRDQANIYEAGFTLQDKNGKTQKYDVTEAQIKELYSKFNKTDKEYIELVRKFFNVDARNLKVVTDELLCGYATIEDTDFYIPIKRDGGSVAKSIGSEQGFIVDMLSEINAVDNKSFNKKTSKDVKIPVFISGLTNIIDNHAIGISTYYGLALPIKNFNKIYNKRIGEGKETVSMRQIINGKVWLGADNYIKNFINDLQGANTLGQNSKILNKMRANFAKFQLGFNPGSILKQLASFATAYNFLDAGSLAKGLFMKANKQVMFKYCPMTKARMNDKTIVKAQGLIENIGVIGDLATKPIQWMDNAVVKRLWNASQVQIQKDKGFIIGSEENLVEAGKLLEKGIRETQSNSITSERSAMSRSKNFLASSFTMFMSDAQKTFSRIHDSVSEMMALKAQIKDGNKTSEIMEKYKLSKKKFRRAITAFAASNMIVALINIFMRWFKNREEDENIAVQIGKEYLSQIFGMFPVIKDIYGYFSDDFEINNYALGMINDLASATKELGELTSKLISGENLSSTQIFKPLRDALYAIGQMTGLPVRNVYNLIYGLVDKFSPETAYKANSLFYNNTSYKSDMLEAMNQDNENMAKAIAQTELANRSDFSNKVVINEISRLLVRGYNVMPKKINKTMSVDGQEYELTNYQVKTFNKIYKESESKLATIINKSNYNSLDDASKAKAIKFILDYYYAKATEEVLQVEIMSSKQLAAESIPVEDLAIYLTVISQLSSEKNLEDKKITSSKKDKVYKYINGLKLKAAQKYILMGAVGYKNKIGEDSVKSYLNSLGFYSQKQTMLLQAAGY